MTVPYVINRLLSFFEKCTLVHELFSPVSREALERRKKTQDDEAQREHRAPTRTQPNSFIFSPTNQKSRSQQSNVAVVVD